MKNIEIPDSYNYIAVFLTLSCNLTCTYCINHLSGKAQKKRLLNGQDWISLINRIQTRPDLPITIQGGEPTIHPHFYQIISGIPEQTPVDLLTNLQFDPIVFKEKIPAYRFKRNAPYASIRASYHPTTMDWKTTLEKAIWLKNNEYSISLNAVLHPDNQEEILRAQKEALGLGLEFKTKEYLGLYQNKIMGTYLYEEACFQETSKTVLCKTSELLISPDGQAYRCHHDLYNNMGALGSLLNPEFEIVEQFKECQKFGQCNPCDVKIKNNRFQEWGHTSVEIKLEPIATI